MFRSKKGGGKKNTVNKNNQSRKSAQYPKRTSLNMNNTNRYPKMDSENRKTSNVYNYSNINKSLHNSATPHLSKPSSVKRKPKPSKESTNAASRASQPRSTASAGRKRRYRGPVRNSGDIAKRFAVFIFVLILGYLFISSYAMFTKQSVKFDVIQYGSIDTSKVSEGIIIRNEKVYTAPKAGVVNYNIADNEKIKKGNIVCTIKDEAAVASMEASLEDINKNILALQQSRDDMSLFSEDVKRVNSQIKDTIDERVYSFVSVNTKELYELKENIKKKIDSRNQMLLSENKGSLQELASKKIEQENEINKNITTIASADGGIVSYFVDGMESTLNLESLNNLTQEQTLMKPDKSEELKNPAAKDSPIFKVILDNSWYIASFIESRFIENWKEGSTVIVYIKDDVNTFPVEAVVFKLQADAGDDKKKYVVLKVDKDIISYTEQRNIKIQVNKALSGIKINKNSIAEENLLKIPEKYVKDDIIIKKTGTTTSMFPIVYSGFEDEGKFILTPVVFGSLNVGDVIVNPSDMADTFTINDVTTAKGVYVINTGITEFKRINITYPDENSTHIILDPNANTNLKLYDRILTDTKNIEKEQKIY